MPDGAEVGSGRVRIAALADAACCAGLYAPYVAETPISFEAEPPDATELGRRMAKILPLFPWLVFEREGRVLGYAYAGPHRERAAYRWAVDVTVYVAREAQRRGIGRALYGRLLPALRLQGYCRAFAGVTLPNPGSVGLHEAMGFVPVGIYRDVGFKSGRWHDVGWWGRELGPLPAEPREPERFTEGIFARSAALSY